ncbi:MBL fold metallo-hydrolase [Photorhabdus sp. P32]|uniref:MBL fold metallo-hydrolase n=1 Tax=Photorhabdus sp. P32 TaxID=3117549 RepID=UPI00311B3320
MSLKITVLLENKTSDSYLIAKPGLSLLLEDGEEKIIFDTGPDGSYIENANRMGISIDDISKIVISHGHSDHIGGVNYFPHNAKLICHPDALSEKYYGVMFNKKSVLKFKKISGKINKRVKKRVFFRLTKSHMKISDRFIFSGEIANNHRKSYGLIRKSSWANDYILDDSALIWKSDNGLVIIIGCGHSGICEIINHAKMITGVDKVYAVIGGLHLRRALPTELLKIREFFIKEDIKQVYGCHCTGSWGRLWLPNVKQLKTGQVLLVE